MKRAYKSMLGVTLLEIMLVLAIAALVIVMSIRFYQSASSSQKVNNMVNLVQGIIAAIESCAGANSGDYASCGTSGLAPYMPSSTMPKNPWGQTTSASGSTGKVTVTMGTIPSPECGVVQNLLKQNSKMSNFSCSTFDYVP